MAHASPRKSLRIRAQWQAHIDAQMISGLSQAVDLHRSLTHFCIQKGP